MSATLSVEPRRAGPSGSASARELPVLFHLMDVTRSRAPAASPGDSLPFDKESHRPAVAPATESEEPAVEEIAAPAAIESQPQAESPAPAAAEPAVAHQSEPISEPIAEHVPAPVAEEIPTADAEIETRSLAAVAAPCQAKDSDSNCCDTSCDAAQVAASSAPEAANSPATEPQAAQEEPPQQPAPAAARPQTEKRHPRAKPKAANAWFANQGRYIAIGFVLALIGTIYLARSNRGSHSETAARPHAHPGEAVHQVAAHDSKPATVVGDGKDSATAESAAAAAAETSPAKLAESSPPEQASQADLLPPTIPQVVREPGPSNQPDNKSLFPWAEPQADRVATRPDAPAGNVAPLQTQYPVTAASAPIAPSYPTTDTPHSSFAAPPVQQPAIPDYRGYVPAAAATAPPPNQGQFVPPPAGPPAAYLPSDNTASGYRYERTGSGPY